MAETIILMKTNLYEVSRKLNFPYQELLDMYEEGLAKNKIVTIKVDDKGKLTFDV